jgi:serine/threonine-protein kinase
MRPEEGDQESRLEELFGRFEAAWRGREQPVIDVFLAEAGSLRASALYDLLAIDLEFRLKAGMEVRVEEYLARFPEITNNPEEVVALVVAEYRFRNRKKPGAIPQEYLERFPKYRDLLVGNLAAQNLPRQLAHGQETVDFATTDHSERNRSAAPKPARSALDPAVATFLDGLQELQLLTGAQLTDLDGVLPAIRDVPALIVELERRSMLTGYQADQLRKNKRGQLVFGSYILLEPLGKGGMGQVFKARHRIMKRVVALKIIRKGHLPHGEAVQRFTREIESAARLSHPNIVTSHDAGRAGDFHFFVMEFVEGTSLDALLKQQGPLPIGLACDLIRQAALGLQHAHDQGLVHRDIKPQNLIVDGRGTVKILDFGLARVRYDPAGGGARALTQMGMIMGTPDFIAPEQILDCSRVDNRADIYSLGCTFYQLLTGQPLYPGTNLREKIEQHLHGTYRPAAELRGDIPIELTTILNRMLARQPADRFASAAEVADALAPLAVLVATPVAGIPSDSSAETFIEAPPKAQLAPLPPAATDQPKPTASTPAQKSGTPASAARGVLIALGLLGIIGGALIAMALLAMVFWPRPPVDAPDNKRPDRETSTPEAFQPGDIPANLRKGLPEDVVAILGDGRVRHGAKIWAVAVSGDGKWIATRDLNSTRISDATTMHEHRILDAPGPCMATAFSPDGTKIACGNPLRMFDTYTGKPLWTKEQQKDMLSALAFTPDGSMLFVGYQKRPVQILNAITGDRIDELDGDTNEYNRFAVAADGSKLVVSGKDEKLRLWDVSSPKPKATTWKEDPGIVSHAAFSPDGKSVVTANTQGKYLIWDVATGKISATLASETNSGWPFAMFLPDGKRLLTMQDNGQAQIRDLKKKDMVTQLSVSSTFAALLDRGQKIVVPSDNTIRVFNVDDGAELLAAAPASSAVTSVAFTPDGKHLLTGTAAGTIRCWDLQARREKYRLTPSHTVYFIVSDPAGARAAWTTAAGAVHTWDVATGKAWLPSSPAFGSAIKFTSDGQFLLVGQTNGQFHLLDGKGKKTVLPALCNSAAAQVDVGRNSAWAVANSAFYVGPKPAGIAFFKLPGGKELKVMEFAGHGVWSIRLSPDNRFLYGGQELGTAEKKSKLIIWEIDSATKKLKVMHQLPAHSGPVYSISLSRDGRTLLTQGGGTVIQWAVPAGNKVEEWPIPDMPPGYLGALDIAPDGRHAAIGRTDGRVLILRLKAAAD